MEEFLLKIGGFGRYQGFLMFFVFVTSFTCGSNYYSQVFSLLEPPKTCISDGLNTQGECLILSANNDTLECSNWSYNYSDQFPTLVSEANWVCEQDIRPQIISTVFWIGNAIGSLIFGISNDLLGRKKTIFISHLIYLIGTIMTLFLTQVYTFQLLARLLVGVSHHTISHLPYLLAIEFCTEKTRVVPLLIVMISYSLSSIILPILSAFYIQHWTHLVYFSISLISLNILIIPLLPESLSWLACTRNKDQFIKVFHYIGNINGYDKENNEVSNNIISEYFKENERTKESVKRRSLLDLTMFKRLFFNCSVITFVCCSCFMCYYGHVQNTANLGSSIYFNFIYGALVEIGAWIAPFIINRLGRRYIISSLLLLSGFSSISFGFTPDNAQLLKLCIALAGRIFITGAYFISLLYASEIFPTEIRGKGMAICEFIGGFGIIFSPSIIYLSKYGNSIPIMIFGVISIMAGLMSCCLPETANHKLAQTMEDGNIFGNNQRILPWIKNSSNKEVPVIV
ncbi:organic cation transporter-like protein isoform X2 [Lepeophtheirus salmonis]|uniref:organic cation transporter-like protein isoform X2 n=1 Tax=Lepeophtheirus salmonis TaxID=72036 RepID=UPI001AE305EA|nr:organic cation transporter-like protein isoform X1 [Lepeophtheirus salmonis]